MSSTSYSVVRYIADPARNEPFNVGVLVWNDAGFMLKVDDTAVSRVIRDNPHLERDALLYLEQYLSHRVTQTVPPFSAEGVLRVISEQSGFPVSLTEPRFIAVTESTELGMAQALDQLLARVVRPPRRRGGPVGLKATSTLQRELKPFLDDKRIERHFALAARSGVSRSVDFYANHGAHLALDVVNLALADAKEIRNRADQEAYKAWDLLKSDLVNAFYVLAVLREDSYVSDVNVSALKIVRSSGAKIVNDVDDAKEVLITAATHSHSVGG